MAAKTSVVMGVVFFAGLAILCRPATASEPAKPGDKVKMHFTCMLPNGKIAATSEAKVTEDGSLPKASIFVAREATEPLVVEAGDDCSSCGNPEERVFEEAIMASIAREVVGMRQGESQTLNLGAQLHRSVDPSKSMSNEGVLQINRERIRPKRIVMTREEYRQNSGKEPEETQPYSPWRTAAIPCNVASVSEKEVIVQCRSENGARVATPFGEGIVSETDKGFRILIDAKVGHLIRSGGFVGRIVNVDDRMITIDYRHPFGGETLKCEVKIDSIEQRAESKEAKSEAGTSVSSKQ
jgi:FKBP-type peptidyl-prolyl cis-trans isomerase 2